MTGSLGRHAGGAAVGRRRAPGGRGTGPGPRQPSVGERGAEDPVRGADAWGSGVRAGGDPAGAVAGRGADGVGFAGRARSRVVPRTVAGVAREAGAGAQDVAGCASVD